MASRDDDSFGREGDASRAHRILVVEDEFLVAALLEADLLAAGYTVVGPFTNLAAAMEASRHEAFDLAVLDVNLHGEMVFPLADELSARGIRFIFLSGYGPQSLPDRHRSTPYMAKPYDPAVLIREIHRLAPPTGA